MKKLEREDQTLAEFEKAFRREIELVRTEVKRIRSERESLHLRDQEERHRRNTILERIDDQYGIDLKDLLARLEHRREEDFEEEAREASSEDVARYLEPLPDWDRDEARKECKELQTKIQRLGNVNLEALEELEELQERYDFQMQQKSDLDESERNLRGIIADINRKSREMFLETFEKVQEQFGELFRKCFGGGRAELVLEEGVDVLEAGIDIVARPPGKKLTSLSLMSGGEKTMTTIALLLAIFRSRPSPFCLLDEVDAPLDEANVQRFVVLLRDFVKQSQFIIITHNKITKAQAGTLYGVTMQERGVSKKVAVELESYDPDAMEAEVVGAGAGT
jgi:chromosome segregation protein